MYFQNHRARGSAISGGLKIAILALFRKWSVRFQKIIFLKSALKRFLGSIWGYKHDLDGQIDPRKHFHWLLRKIIFGNRRDHFLKSAKIAISRSSLKTLLRVQSGRIVPHSIDLELICRMRYCSASHDQCKYLFWRPQNRKNHGLRGYPLKNARFLKSQF